MASVLLSALGVLGAYGAVDYGFYRTLGTDLTVYQGGEISDQAMIACAIAAGCLFVAAAAGRISGLGPLLAGLVLGAGPCAWIVLDHASYVARANDIPEMWNHTSFGLVGAAVVLYPTVAGAAARCRGGRQAGDAPHRHRPDPRPDPAFGSAADLRRTARFVAMTRRLRTVLSLVAALGLAALPGRWAPSPRPGAARRR